MAAPFVPVEIVARAKAHVVCAVCDITSIRPVVTVDVLPRRLEKVSYLCFPLAGAQTSAVSLT